MPRAKVGASHEDEKSAAAGHEEAVGRLRAIPNVGPKMTAELLKLGVRRLEDAAGRDPDEMYHELCTIDAKRHDPCVGDVFAAVVSYAHGGGKAVVGVHPTEEGAGGGEGQRGGG